MTKTNTRIHAHIQVAAKSFERGESVYIAETEVGESIALFHRKIWRLARKLGYKWQMRRDGLRVEIRPKSKVK